MRGDDLLAAAFICFTEMPLDRAERLPLIPNGAKRQPAEAWRSKPGRKFVALTQDTSKWSIAYQSYPDTQPNADTHVQPFLFRLILRTASKNFQYNDQVTQALRRGVISKPLWSRNKHGDAAPLFYLYKEQGKQTSQANNELPSTAPLFICSPLTLIQRLCGGRHAALSIGLITLSAWEAHKAAGKKWAGNLIQTNARPPVQTPALPAVQHPEHVL